MNNAASELCNKRFENYYDKYNELSYNKKDRLDQNLKPTNSKLKDYDYDGWFTEEEKALKYEKKIR